MIEAVPFAGIMDMDSPDGHIPPAFHKMARNVVFRGLKGNKRAENAKGTTLIPNSLLPATGINKTIGAKYDPIRKRIYFFNYNSANLHGIYMFNTINSAFQRVVVNGVNAVSGTLGFTASGTIYNVDIVYGDALQGDLLCFIDSLGLPKKINVDRAFAGGYGTIQKSFMDIAKEPAEIPPYVVYEDDPSATVNNLRKRLFKFKIRWVFDDNDKSVTSSQSEMPIPYDVFNTATDTDPTKNCRLAIVYQTGPQNVKKIEILGALSLGNVYSDYFRIASIDKQVENIESNDVATYLFYNDKAYDYINIEESIQLFDWVPQRAQAQCLLNGNVLGYGNVTEGYPNITNFGNGTNTSSITPSSAPYYSGRFFSLLVASQAGASGFESGDVHIVIRGRVSPGNKYSIFFADGTEVWYSVNSGEDLADVIEGLRVDAINKGFSIVSVGVNDLYIFKPGAILARFLVAPMVDENIGENIHNQSLAVYDWWSTHGFALVYFDEKGRTNGAVYTDGFSVSSLPYTESGGVVQIPKFTLSIYHRPPIWAQYYQWVRTKDTTKSKILQWISDRTFKDTSSSLGQNKYAYIGIESLNQYRAQYPESPLGYSFAPNDRIRFIKRLDANGSTAIIYTQKDFEIVSSEMNPRINGISQTGQFIKILLPTTDGDFDFGASGYDNYFIELYAPAQSVANGLDVYYEFGERYAIGNEGTDAAYHQGMLQNQLSNLTIPATFEFTKGDFFARRRSIQTGNVYSFDIFPGGGDQDTFLVGMTFTGSTYNDTNIIAQSVPYQPLTGSFDPGSDTRKFIRSITQNTFRIEGNFIFNFLEDISGDSWQLYLEDRYGNRTIVIPPFDASRAGVYNFNIETTITLNNNWLFLIAASAVSQKRKVNFLASNLKATVDRTLTQVCIDPNFSDYYASQVNSNGRPFSYNPDTNTVNYPVLLRWGLTFQRDTNINQINRFEFQNAADFDRSKGAIMRFGVFERMLTIFQERKVGQVGVYQKFIRDNAGTNQLVTTDEIITKNNIDYYLGDFGVANQPDSVVQSGFVYYFADPIKGKILRLSRDGMSDLSELYRVQTWAGGILPKYLKSHVYSFGGSARITGAFNIRDDNEGEYLLVAQGGVGGDTIIGETLAFDENENAFTSFYDFAPDYLVCAENALFSFRSGALYSHKNTTTYTNFYGAQYEPSITKAFNANLLQKKTWISVNEVSNVIWDCPDIYTAMSSVLTAPQQSSLVLSDFKVLEGQAAASFRRDKNSIGGVINGDALKGDFIVIKFRVPQATSSLFSFISLFTIKYINSPLTSI